MSLYKIKLTKIAVKDLKKLDKKYQKVVGKAIDRLAENPKLGKPLKGKLKGVWRLRFSRYRILYEIQNKKLIVIVFEVKHRKEVYR